MFRTPQRSTKIVIAALAAVLVGLAAPLASAQTITMTDLGTVPGSTQARAVAVNEAGDAVGMVVLADGRNRAALYRNGTVTDLGTLCGAACPSSSNDYSNAADINDQRQIVGVSYDTSGQQRAFIWENGVMTALPSPPGASATSATAINNHGAIVGRASVAAGFRAVLWASPTAVPQVLGVLGVGGGTSFSSAYGLNENGQVVGESTIAGTTFRRHGFVWDSTNGMRDLGPGESCFDGNWAVAINDHGDVAGGQYFNCATTNRMTRWVGGVMEDLGSLQGPAGRSYPGNSITAAGEIPGSSDGACGEVEAVVWSEGQMIPLGGPYVIRDDCHLSYAYGMNNQRQIVGEIYTSTGEIHAVLWTLPPPVNLAPSIACTEPGMSAWYHSDVVVSCTTEAPLGLADPGSAAFALTTAGQGAAVSTNAHAPVCDPAGHCSAIIGPFGPFKVDKTAPAVSVTGVINGLTYAAGFVPTAGCSTTDTLSGVQTTAALTMSGGPLGAMAFTCGGAADLAGNLASPVTASINVSTPVPVNSLALTGTLSVTQPGTMAMSPDQSTLYVLAGPDGRLVAIDAGTLQVKSSVLLGAGFLFEVAISPDGRRAYVAISKFNGSTTLAEDARLAVVDLTVNPPVLIANVPLTLPTGAKVVALTGVAVHPTAPRVYVTDRAASRVFEVDTNTLTQVGSTPVAGGALGSAGSTSVKVTPDGTRLYVANRGNPTVTNPTPITIVELNLATGSATSIPSQLKPSGNLSHLAMAPDGKRILVTSFVDGESRVSAINTDPVSPTFRQETMIPTSANRLEGISYTADGRYAYVVDSAAHLIVIDAVGLSVVRTIAVGGVGRDVVSRHGRGTKAFVARTGDWLISAIGTPAPTITAPSSVSGGEGSAITLSATVSDADSPTLSRSWTYSASGGATGVCAFGDASSAATTITCSDNGTYTATLTVDDGDNLPTSRSVTITVTNAAPTGTFTAPDAADESQTFAVSIAGASDSSSDDSSAGLTYAFDCGSGYGAFDVLAGAVCTAPSAASAGSVSVRGSVRDKDGGVTEYSATITVRDTTKPTVTTSGNQVIEASGPQGASAVFTASASDNVDGSLAAACSPVSGSMFAVNQTTTVTCTATDAAGNVGSGSLTIAVVDTTAPVLHLPSNLSLVATSAAGAPAVFAATATDLVSGSVTVTCSLGSGAMAPIGMTSVDCSAADAAGNITRGTFSIAVRYNVCLLYDPAKVNKGGSTVPIKVQLCSASGQNLSSASITVQAISLALVSSSADGAVDDAGQSNPDGNFRYDSSLAGYIFNLKTTGLPTGTYNLRFTAGTAPGVAVAPFKLR